MAADNLPLSTLISYNSGSDRDYKVLESKYGNGVSQVAGDGLNNVQRKWTIAWAPLTLSQFQTLMPALDAAGGYQYFLWTPPGEAQAKWLIKNPHHQLGGPNVYAVNATAEEFFAP
jgi:phage-related protein